MALSKTTQDHDEIRNWAEARGAKPAEVASTEKNGETGILRIEFPKAKNHNDSALKEISWDEFFEKFDASGLALVYQEVTKEGAESNFNKLIHPDDADHPSAKTAPAKAASGAKKVSATKTSARGAAASGKAAASSSASTKSSSGKSSPTKAAPTKAAPAKTAAKAAPKPKSK